MSGIVQDSEGRWWLEISFDSHPYVGYILLRESWNEIERECEQLRNVTNLSESINKKFEEKKNDLHR